MLVEVKNLPEWCGSIHWWPNPGKRRVNDRNAAEPSLAVTVVKSGSWVSSADLGGKCENLKERQACR
ncbi:hypothetical protein NSS79_27565 [Paenibacillus sp. FSL L8-0436]|uniref:hypothetical protein n=1 Tax=Paenibacillus sp. FSL L8-0436 TaxID=2954686 RepID=UPI0031590989